MLLRLNLFLLEDRVKRERGKPFRNLESLLFSDSICLPHFTDEEFEAQGGEFTPAELDEHGLIFTLITKLCALHHNLCKSSPAVAASGESWPFGSRTQRDAFTSFSQRKEAFYCSMLELVLQLALEVRATQKDRKVGLLHWKSAIRYHVGTLQ